MKFFLGILGFFAVCGLSVFLSLQFGRILAKAFATPTPYSWEYVYVSESPKAMAYHYSDECRFLKITKYHVALLTVDEAEEYGLSPCKKCLKDSVKYQYDEAACLLIFPMMVFLFWLIAKTEKLIRNYTYRSPIVKRNNSTTKL